MHTLVALMYLCKSIASAGTPFPPPPYKKSGLPQSPQYSSNTVSVHIFYILSVYIVSLTFHLLCICISSKLYIYIRGVNPMVRHDSIRYRFSYSAIRYLPIPQKILLNYSIRYRSISIDISILSYYIPILNNHLHFY